jgi:hypothetical protein
VTALLAAVAGLIGGVVLSQLSTAGTPVLARPTPQMAEVVRAEKFELVGQTGTRRALLELEPNGEPALKLYDAEGNLRAGLSLRPDGGPNLLFWDGQTTTPRAGLALLPNGFSTTRDISTRRLAWTAVENRSRSFPIEPNKECGDPKLNPQKSDV